MIRFVVVGMLVVVVAALQTAVLPLMSIGGFRPDLLLLVTVAFAVDDGPEVGVRIGFAAGLLTDLLLATSAIGVASLTMTVVGYAVGTARPFLAPNSSTAPLLLGFVGSTVGALVLGLLSSVLGDAILSADLLVTACIVVGLSHTLLLPLVLRVTRGISTRFPVESASAAR